VVESSLAELAWQARLHEMMGNNRRCLVIHGGGIYGDPIGTSARLIEVLLALPDVIKKRLCLENDERSWCLERLAPISLATGIPLIFDNLHHALNPGRLSIEEALTIALSTWEDDVPKIHYSEQAPDKRPGSHSEYLTPEKVRPYLMMERSFDIMLECKAKDLALLEVREALGYKEEA
jgi:UV DNA damage endonuclease